MVETVSEVVTIDGEVAVPTPKEQKISGIEIRDVALDPYHVVADYHGFHVYEGNKKHSGTPFPGEQQALLDIIKRKIANTNRAMSLSEFNDYVGRIYNSLIPKQQQ